MIVTIKRGESVNGALLGKVYVNGSFFGYTLENENYKIPIGNYNAFLQQSPKFGKRLLYIDVPGHTGILFHNGNTKDDTKGCVIVASERGTDTVKNGIAEDLANIANNAINDGQSVSVRVYNNNDKVWIAITAGLLAMFYFLNGHSGE